MIKIIIKSFFHIEIFSFLKFFFNNIKKKYLILGPFFLPLKKKKFTFLVSPHVDKNSRDQMHIKNYKFFFYIKNFDNNLISFLLKNRFINGLILHYFFI